MERGGCILLGPGVFYLEMPVLISGNKPFRIQGVGAKSGVNGVTELIIRNPRGAFELQSEHCVLSDMFIRSDNKLDSISAAVFVGSGSSQYENYVGAPAAHCKLENLQIRNINGHGVCWLEGSHLLLSNVVIAECGNNAVHVVPGFDNHHATIFATHLSNNGGWGWYEDFSSKFQSGSHCFFNLKVFGNKAGGIKFSGKYNCGSVFLENNHKFGGIPLLFSAESSGNVLDISGEETDSALVRDLGIGNSYSYYKPGYGRLISRSQIDSLHVGLRSTSSGVVGIKNAYKLMPFEIGEIRLDPHGMASFSVKEDGAKYGVAAILSPLGEIAPALTWVSYCVDGSVIIKFSNSTTQIVVQNKIAWNLVILG